LLFLFDFFLLLKQILIF